MAPSEEAVMPLEPECVRPSSGAWKGRWPQTIEEFEALVVTFQDRLVQYAWRRLGNRSDAEDAIQEVFLTAYTRRWRLRLVAHVGPYLYRMAANQCADLLRQRRRKDDHEEPFEESAVEEIASPDRDARHLAAAAEEMRRIEAMLRGLPPAQAEVVRLRAFEELRFPDIARIAGCSLATVKSRMRYGQEKLRAMISQDKGESQ